MRLDTPDLLTKIHHSRRDGALLFDGSLRYVVFCGPCEMTPIIRTDEELFTDTIARRGSKLKVVVNGNYYNLTLSGKLDAFLGSDPVAARQTLIEGQVVMNGRVIGQARPNHFYFAQVKGFRKSSNLGHPWHFVAGRGDPPKGASVVAAVGGLGPLLIDDLPFAAENEYRPGTAGPETGDPGTARKGLLRRSNATFASVDKRPNETGKTIIAYSTRYNCVLVGVQEDGRKPGQTYSYIVRSLELNDFDQAVFLDGSDSSTLMLDGKIIVRPGQNKDETIAVGIGFSYTPLAKAAAPSPARRDPFLRPPSN